jgi:hypothetical protein
MKCYCCEKPLYSLVNQDEHKVSNRPEQICCRRCSQRVFDIREQAQWYWKNDRDQCDGVFMDGWQETINKVRTMGICPQCGEPHQEKGNG